MARSLLILHCHDLGRFLGTYGVSTVSTPNLDALAAESAVFDAAFATAPHCSPARASIFTGTYPQQHGVLGLAHEPFGWDLVDPSSHIAHRLHDAGYRTELVGVHHESRVLPDDQVASRLGFDRVRSGGDRDVVAQRAEEALTEAAASGRPFYLQAGFHEPHRTRSDSDAVGTMGFLAPGVEADVTRGVSIPPFLRDSDGSREEIAELQGAVRAMDEGVGRVLARLDELGLSADTIVVFTTDHGLALPRAKCTLYDAGLGVALMVRVPGRDSWHARRIQTPVSHVDLLPTLFELAGLPPVTSSGESLVPLVEQDLPARPFTYGQLSYHTYFDPKRSVRSESHKLIANFTNAPRSMDPTQSWLHRSLPVDLTGATIETSPALELYDLRGDPDELHNVIDDPDQQTVVTELSAALLEWMRSTDDPLFAGGFHARRHDLTLAALDSNARSGADERQPAHS